jgi:hypothetical protein
MIYLLVLLPATGLAVAGYVALFLSARSEGAMRAFGKYLGFWAFTLAGLLVLSAIFAAAHHRGHCPWMHGHMGDADRCPMMHGHSDDSERGPMSEPESTPPPGH